MEAVLVSVATGALKPVLEKLAALLGDKYKRVKGVRKDIKSLTHELAAMDAFVMKMSEDEDPNKEDKLWMNEVRELSYDMEDCIDDFMQSVNDKDPKPEGFIEKIRYSHAKMKASHRIGNEIHDLKKQITEAGERNGRYNTRQAFSNTKNATIDPRALAIFEHASKLVGIDEPKAEIIKLLNREDGCASTQEQLKVVSIVGSGGMGKTTLANQVYLELEKQFDCRAFLSVSRNPDMMNILRIILSEVSNQHYADTEAGSIQQLINKTKLFLADKRYFIVIDDIWNEESWDVIKFAFPTTNSGSRIITTTRLTNVAQACHSSFRGHIYAIWALNMVHSIELFHGRLFNSQVYCPSYLQEVSEEILKKCPLAVIAVSGLLTNIEGTKHAWNQVKDSIGHPLERNPSVDKMMQILSLSYFDLPPHLKTCLLYLSLFPEDSIIEKNDLIRRWIAEGLIRTNGRYTAHEIGDRCFNELVNRNLIQPMKTVRGPDYNITQFLIVMLVVMQVDIGDMSNPQGNEHNMKYTVHDTIHDFIISKSVEENFATLFGDPSLPVGTERKVRRLCIQVRPQGNSIPLTDLVFSHTRSLSVFASTMEFPWLAELRYLRVLTFDKGIQLENHHIRNIGKLFHLRYLNLRWTEVSELPEEIGHLFCLEMLDIRGTQVCELPATIVNLGRLVDLLTNSNVKFPDGIVKMQALEVLEEIGAYRQPLNFWQELGQLQNLRKLVLNFQLEAEVNQKECNQAISSALRELSTENLRSLTTFHGGSFLQEGPLCPVAPSLEEFIMTNSSHVERVPKWVSSLVNLQLLRQEVIDFRQEDLCVLGSLQMLLILEVTGITKVNCRQFTVRLRIGFPCLRKFSLGKYGWLVFEDGSMPKLEKLEMWLNLHEMDPNTDIDIGIGNLPSLITLKYSTFRIHKIKNLKAAAGAAKATMERAASTHPNRPTLIFHGTG